MSDNQLELCFPAHSGNIALGRIALVAFLAPLDPLVGEVEEVKLAISELVTNCVKHAYPDEPGPVHVTMELSGRTVSVTVSDEGVGCQADAHCEDKLGFTLVRECTDDFKFVSSPGRGSTASFQKTFSTSPDVQE